MTTKQQPPVIEPNPANTVPDEMTGRALRLRIRQQELLAELGVLALQGTSFSGMLEHTARMTAEGLGAEYCKVLEYQPADNRLLVRAGVGWDDGVVGHATVGADRLCPAYRQAGHLQSSRKRATLQNPRTAGRTRHPPRHERDPARRRLAVRRA